jgi:hypothetical protein
MTRVADEDPGTAGIVGVLPSVAGTPPACGGERRR